MNTKELYFFQHPHSSNIHNQHVNSLKNIRITLRNERLVYSTLTSLIQERLNRLKEYDIEVQITKCSQLLSEVFVFILFTDLIFMFFLLIQNDRQLLATSNLSNRIKMAIQYRIEQVFKCLSRFFLLFVVLIFVLFDFNRKKFCKSPWNGSKRYKSNFSMN
jgi:hypothetical protein